MTGYANEQSHALKYATNNVIKRKWIFKNYVVEEPCQPEKQMSKRLSLYRSMRQWRLPLPHAAKRSQLVVEVLRNVHN